VYAYYAPLIVAAGSGGATATASSSYTAYGLTPDKAINGSRTSSGGYWNDNTSNVFEPEEYLQVNFAGAKTIREVDVFCLQDGNGTAEPTEAMTFTQYGLTQFEVQYMSASGWVTVPGGVVSGNDRVWRKFIFAPVTTDRIRVLVHDSADVWSRVVEVEAYEGVAAAAADLRWLVTDQLGTPRMVVDRTGSLAGVTRHDYLPFGEALPGDATFRTQGRGYVTDGIRQKFTGYERDAEISLDYAQARYYSGSEGRFTSPDPLLASGRPALPQSWNRYSYALNNPLRFTDPSGLIDGPAPCGQKTNGQEKQVIVPQDVIRGAMTGWKADNGGDDVYDGEITLPPAVATHVSGVASANYRAEFIQLTDAMNADKHGGVSQTNVQQENGSGTTSGSLSERSAEFSISPKPGATFGAAEANSSGASTAGKTTVSQTLDPAARCNAIALDKSATIVNANAVTKLEGMTVTVNRGGVRSTMKLSRAQATTIVQVTTNFARKRGAVDATVVYPSK
jgi:RHS repeat-associated protein